MAVNWPNSPADGQEFSSDGTTWRWDATAGVWVIISGVGEGFLPLIGGTITGNLNVDGLTSLTGNVTTSGSVLLEGGATAQADLVLENVDAVLQAGSVTFSNLAGDTVLGRFAVDAGVVEFRHGVADTLVATYSGSGWGMALDLTVGGNLAVTGEVSSGGIKTMTVREFLDPTGVTSWRITNETVLEQWGTTASGLSQGKVVMPKRYANSTTPSIIQGVAANGVLRVVAFNSVNPAVTDPLKEFWVEVRGPDGNLATAQTTWHAIGIWDGVS